ncbi:MAG: hypothetical protein QOH54_5732, partial [Mycobacterium sp.]|nr:hypothetical protein [Mycobacterium sp.]
MAGSERYSAPFEYQDAAQVVHDAPIGVLLQAEDCRLEGLDLTVRLVMRIDYDPMRLSNNGEDIDVLPRREMRCQMVRRTHRDIGRNH